MILVIALGVLAVVALFLLAQVLAGAVSGSSEPTVAPGQPVEVTILPGSSARTIAVEMQNASVVSARDLEEEVRDRAVADQLKAGTYALETGMAAADVVAQLVQGPNTQSSQSTVTIVEGLTVTEILQSLAAQTGLPVAEFEAALRSGVVSSPFLASSGVDPETDLAAWEGLLYPATYAFSEETDAALILNTMSAELVRRVGDINWSGLSDLGLSRYEALIVASLVEREAKLDADRPLIASVIYNRLAENMPKKSTQPSSMPWARTRAESLPPTSRSTLRTTPIGSRVCRRRRSAPSGKRHSWPPPALPRRSIASTW